MVTLTRRERFELASLEALEHARRLEFLLRCLVEDSVTQEQREAFLDGLWYAEQLARALADALEG